MISVDTVVTTPTAVDTVVVICASNVVWSDVLRILSDDSMVESCVIVEVFDVADSVVSASAITVADVTNVGLVDVDTSD